MSYPIGTLKLVAIQDAIYNWITSVTRGVIDEGQIIWRNGSEPLPARPCVSLKFIYGPAPIARDPNILSGGSGNDTAGMQMEATLSVQVFGNTKTHRPMANQLAIDLNSSLLLRGIREALNIGGVSIHDQGRVRNLTALEESQYEERAGFDVMMGMVQNIVDPVGTIETINLEKTVNGNETDQRIILP